MNDQQRIDIARADAARRIIEDPMVKEAFEAIEQGIQSAWADTPIRDSEAREHLFRLLQAKRKFEAVFHAHMQNGTIATAELKAEEERRGLMSRIKERVYG
jgi:hypothetical protein